MIIQYKKLSEDAHDPIKHYDDDACFDIMARGEHMLHDYATISTGIVFNIPSGYCGMIMSRSGLAAKDGVFVLNAPGIVDAGYAGETKVILGNLSDHTWEIHDGERIAQIMFVKLKDITLHRFDATMMFGKRGDNGFGSTGY